MCVFFRRGMSDSSACFLFSPSFLRSFSRSQSCCLFPHTQRFSRAALIFAAARGHYQLIDYFDCYLIPPLGRGAHMCKCSLSLSLFLSLGLGGPLSFFCALSQVRKRELSTHQSPPGRHGGTSGPLCFRFTLPVVCCCCRRPLHFRCRDSEAVVLQQFRAASGLSPFEAEAFQGFGDGPRGTGKIDSSPSLYFQRNCGVSPHARPHMQYARDTPEQPTHQHQRNLSTFLFFLSFAFVVLCSGTWFQWFSSHSGVFQSFVTIFSYFHAHSLTYTHTCGGILRTLSK